MNPPADDRPFDHTPIETADLPPTPVRDRNISATAWTQALNAYSHLASTWASDPMRRPTTSVGGLAALASRTGARTCRYLAIDSRDLSRSFTFELADPNAPGGQNRGQGPSGIDHARFRLWKEDLLGRDLADD